MALTPTASQKRQLNQGLMYSQRNILHVAGKVEELLQCLLPATPAILTIRASRLRSKPLHHTHGSLARSIPFRLATACPGGAAASHSQSGLRVICIAFNGTPVSARPAKRRIIREKSRRGTTDASGQTPKDAGDSVSLFKSEVRAGDWCDVLRVNDQDFFPCELGDGCDVIGCVDAPGGCLCVPCEES